MAKKDNYFYVGVKYAEGVKGDDDKEDAAYNALCNLAEKWGQVSMGTSEHTEGSNLEFGFPKPKRRSALSFLEESLDSGHVSQVAIAKGERGY